MVLAMASKGLVFERRESPLFWHLGICGGTEGPRTTRVWGPGKPPSAFQGHRRLFLGQGGSMKENRSSPKLLFTQSIGQTHVRNYIDNMRLAC